MLVSQSTMKNWRSTAWRSSWVRSAAGRAVRSRKRSRAVPATYSSSCSSSTGVKLTVQRMPGCRSSIQAMS